MIKSFSTTALVIKRRNYRETDQFTTIFCQPKGKLTVVSKGVRTLKSSKKAAIEPGNIIKAFIVNTKGMPILTQARLSTNCYHLQNQLSSVRQLTQLLEIIDSLFVEEEIEDQLFQLVLTIHHQILNNQSNQQIKHNLKTLVSKLGYQHLDQTNHSSILDYISEIIERPMLSFDYLKVS